MRIGLALACFILVAWQSTALAADTATSANETIRDMSPVTVAGVQPGPGMWKVHGPDGHVLWVLGTVSPLPAGLQWKSADVEAVIANADVVLGPPSLVVNADIGFFRGMALVPAAWGAMKNPDGARLEDILSERQYSRWRKLKDRYLGWEPGIERWRPTFAAERLLAEALKEHGMKRDVINVSVDRLVSAAGRRITPVVLKLTIDDPRGLLKDLKRADLDDAACLDGAMTMIERRMPVLVARANAWSTGDIGVLEHLPGADAESDCLTALLDSQFVRAQGGVGDIARQVRDTWLAEADKALVEHKTSFAVLSMDQVLHADGYLEELAGRGYTVEAP